MSELKLRPPKRIMRKREERARGSVWEAKRADDASGRREKRRGERPQPEDCGYRGMMGRFAPWAKAQGLRPRVYSPGPTDFFGGFLSELTLRPPRDKSEKQILQLAEAYPRDVSGNFSCTTGGGTEESFYFGAG